MGVAPALVRYASILPPPPQAFGADDKRRHGWIKFGAGMTMAMPLAIAAVVRDLAAFACVFLLFGVFAFGGRIWPKPRFWRTIWQPDTREEAAKALRESKPED